MRLGADINMENDKGSTALYWAVRYGYPDMVKLLAGEGKANVHQVGAYMATPPNTHIPSGQGSNDLNQMI